MHRSTTAGWRPAAEHPLLLWFPTWGVTALSQPNTSHPSGLKPETSTAAFVPTGSSVSLNQRSDTRESLAGRMGHQHSGVTEWSFSPHRWSLVEFTQTCNFHFVLPVAHRLSINNRQLVKAAAGDVCLFRRWEWRQRRLDTRSCYMNVFHTEFDSKKERKDSKQTRWCSNSVNLCRTLSSHSHPPVCTLVCSETPPGSHSFTQPVQSIKICLHQYEFIIIYCSAFS